MSYEILKNSVALKSDSADILTQAPLNQHDAHVTRPEDWQLSGIEWKLDADLGLFANKNPKYVVDSTTGKRYFNEDRMIVRLKCIYPGLVLITLLAIAVGAFNVAYRSIKVLSGYHFWGNLEEEKTYAFTAEVQIGNSIKCHTFKARFDDLSKMNKLVNARNLNLISIEKEEDDDNVEVYNLIIKTSEGEGVAIKALETKLTETTTDSNGTTLSLSELKKLKETYDLETRFLKCVKDITRIAASFIIILPLVLSALYGLWKPYEARKLISSIALAVCGTDQVAACFAPSPSFHALGGNINTQGAF